MKINNLSILSLVAGVLSIFLAWNIFGFILAIILGITAIILSIVSKKQMKTDEEKASSKIFYNLGLITGIIGLLISPILVSVLMYRGAYNEAISYQETVDEQWSNVGAQYQRRADLVPQLVATVKGAAENEKGILQGVTEARAGIVNAKTPEDMELMGKKINTAINLAFEAYPQIRSTENFQDLQAQLEGTENRIVKARADYNESIKQYNAHIRGFFNSMFLNSATFPKKEGFKAAAGTEVAPTVAF